MRGQTPQLENKLDRYSTMGVFPFPPHVKLPTLITGTGNLHPNNKNHNKLFQFQTIKTYPFGIIDWKLNNQSTKIIPLLVEQTQRIKVMAGSKRQMVDRRNEGKERDEGTVN